MHVDPSFIPLGRLLGVFWLLLLVGIALTFPLFNFDSRKFLRSGLFIKIMLWIPIFFIFICTLFFINFGRLLLLILLIIGSVWELVLVIRVKKRHIPILIVYYLFFFLALLHLIFIEISYNGQFINLLITLTFASFLADVTAFFLGNYFGYHKLPSLLNDNKSWEGVFGQILGALIGVLLVNALIIPAVSIFIFLPIGFGSAVGDLSNSFIKRKVGIKDWSKAIPGHGGFIDRMSSYAGSALFMFYFLKII